MSTFPKRRRPGNVVQIKTPGEIEKIRASARLASRTLDHAGKIIKAGMTTRALDKELNDFIKSRGGVSASLGYKGFPGATCVSVNEEVCHGIPGSRVLKDGDLVKIDVTTILNGYFGDTCRTYHVGNVSPAAAGLAKASYDSMMDAIATVRNGSHIGDIGAAIQARAEPQGFSVVRDFVGHGVGLDLHEPPSVYHYGTAGTGLKLKTGMVITIEPMINEGCWEIEVLSDGWTAVTADRKLSAQYEHTLSVTDTGAEILTLSD
ncbi:MAG: type I methionyl aminopeptidase [Deltaproteobacteria bacterium]|nr:type I methionyl aminopeptidase [Deltaproteobacteria bacterium]